MPTVRRLWVFVVAALLLALAFLVVGHGGGIPVPLLAIGVVAVAVVVVRGWARFPEAWRRTGRKVLDTAFLIFFVVYTAAAILWLVTGLATALAEGSPSLHRSLHRIGGTSPATRVVGGVVAKDVKFLSTRLELSGSGEVRFRFTNQDSDGHNVAIYRTKDARDPVFVGTVFTGPETVSYEFQLPPPGVYFFRCDPHPQDMSGILVVRPGPPGGEPVDTNAPRVVATLARGISEAAHSGQTSGKAVLQYLFSVVNVVLAIFLIRVRPRDGAARLLAVGMIGTAAVFNLQAHTTLTVLPTYTTFHDPLHLISGVSYLYALLLFPDGRLPRFSRNAMLKWPLRAVTVLAFLIAGVTLGSLHGNPSGYVAFFGIAIPVAGFLSQAARYRYAVSPEERQQSKLLMWALGLGFLTAIAFFVGIGILRSLQTESGFVDLRRDAFGVFPALFLVIPVTLVVILLRRRLWDIERVINRTLVYGTLAWIIGILYVVVVVGISDALGRRNGANVGLFIAATALVAVAFEPLRDRLQGMANVLIYGKRATPYEVISHFSGQMAETLETEEILPRMAEAAARGVGAERARVRVVLPGGGEESVVWPPGAPQAEFDRVITVMHNREPVGQIAVAKPPGEPLTASEDGLLADLASQAGLAMRNVQLTVELQARLAQISGQAADLRDSRQRIVTARDAEQRRLERQIHDGAERELKTIETELRRAGELLNQDPQLAVGVLEQVGTAANETLAGLRDLARGIFPPLLTDRGLAAALEAQVRKLRSAARLEFDPSVLGARFPAAAEAAAYFCCLEALANADRHARAAPVSLRVAQRDGWLEFVVEDEGPGFDPSRPSDWAGLQRMRDRLEALGGSLEVGSAPGRGTRIAGRVPVVDQARRMESLEPVG
jgi:signal transduction histidine kinase/plastocyanin